MDAAETDQAPNMKSVFLPITSEREGWTPTRSRLLLRFASSGDVDATNPVVRCQCGATRAWNGADDPALPRWVGEHGLHMPALPHEPPEIGNLLEQNDEGQFLSMRPARRWPDGRVEVVEQTFDGPPPPSSGEMPPDLEAAAMLLARTALQVAHAIDIRSEPTIAVTDWDGLAADLRESADRLLLSLRLGEEETS